MLCQLFISADWHIGYSIDNFRGIKDSLGYAFWDAMLESTAKLLIALINNRKELLGKIGSEQFAIIAYGQDEKKFMMIQIKFCN